MKFLLSLILSSSVLLSSLGQGGVCAFAMEEEAEEELYNKIEAEEEPLSISEEERDTEEAKADETEEGERESETETETEAETEAETETETETEAESETEPVSEPAEDAEQAAAADDNKALSDQEESILITVTDKARYEASDKVSEFVERCYTIILGRNAGSGEIKKKADALKKGTETGATILWGFFFSKEFTNKKYSDKDYIQLLYKAAFNRNADATGLKNRSEELKLGFSREFVLYSIIRSKEFTNLCSKYGIRPGTIPLKNTLDKYPSETKYVYDLYQNVLGRKPDSGGHISGVTLIREQGAAALAAKLFGSSEYNKKNRSDESFIRDAYRGALKRNAESSAVTNKKAQIDNGLSRMYVLKNILTSAEFSKKSKAAGVKAGTFPSSYLKYGDLYPVLTEYVVKTYRGGLNRKPGQKEIDSKVRELNEQELYPLDQLSNTAFSAEFNSKHKTNEEVVKGFYKLLLLRSASSSEVESLTKRLKTYGKRNLFNYITDSKEFNNICAKYGLSNISGFSRRYLVRYLEGQEETDYYLGTPYTSDWGPNSIYCTVPNGERWYDGYAAMNCSGFVASVFRNCGINLYSITSVTGLPIANAYSWRNYCLRRYPQAVRTFTDKTAMLAADRQDNSVAEKGDLLFMDPKEWGEGADCHVGIYWGSSPGQDRFWHQPHAGNSISTINLPWPECTMYVIKIDLLAKALGY